MKQKKKIFYKILYIILLIAIIYNFLFLATTVITRKEYLSIFGIKTIPLKGLVIARGRKHRTITRR